MPKKSKKILTKEPSMEMEEQYEDSDDQGVEPNGVFDFSEEEVETIRKQACQEYAISKLYLQPKITQWQRRLKLYSNQKRDDKAVGDPLVYTIFQTVFASLYEDVMTQTFRGRDGKEGDDKKAKMWQALAEFDYEEMGMSELMYAWIWDTLFFGCGYLMMMEYDRETYTPIPEVIDPFSFFPDPKAQSINGTKNKNKSRFFGREIELTKHEIEENPNYDSRVDVKQSTVTSTDPRESKRLRIEAQGFNAPNIEGELHGEENELFPILEWFTHYKGQKVIITLANDQKAVLRAQKLPFNYFPTVDMWISPIAHQQAGVSLLDLIEDKQRMSAKMLNLSMKTAEAGLYPQYLYDTNKITNKKHLDLAFNKAIPTKGSPNGAVEILQRPGIKAEAQWVIDYLHNAAEQATATPDIKQGNYSAGERSATENSLVSSNLDTRYGLSAKIFGWSFKRMWLFYYRLYNKYFVKNIDDKLIRISGFDGDKYIKVKPEDILYDKEPDIIIESKTVSDRQKATKLNNLMQLRVQLAQDPAANMKFLDKKVASMYAELSDEDLLVLFPPSADELDAEMENNDLNRNKFVPIDVRENHLEHLAIHAKASDTKAKFNHVMAHKKAMIAASKRSDLMPQPQPIQGVNPMTDKEMVTGSASQPSPDFSTPNTMAV